MLNMIDAQVPGLYAFFLDEESGRQGSTWSARCDAHRYDEINTFISFDRKGTDDIIATQSGEECCSDTFQKALADLLNDADKDFDYLGGAIGSFTDSASFMDDWAECTNISVGYDLQHTPKETQLVGHAVKLKNALCHIGHRFHADLPVERDPHAVVYDRFPSYGGYPDSGYYDDLDDNHGFSRHELQILKTGGLVTLCDTFPDAVAELMEEMGFTPKEVANYIGQVYFGIGDIRSADTQ